MPAFPAMTRHHLSRLLLGPALLLAAAAAAMSPAAAAAAGPVASTACTTVGTTATCDLYARAGSLTLPGAVTTSIWGYSSASSGATGVPGPVLIVNSGDHVTVNVTNQLSVTTSVLFEGQAMVPDLTGIGAGATKSYTFTAGTPGTYLYEAGILPGTQYQVAKGLYGALVVRPAGGLLQATADATTAFSDEAVVVLSEVDTTLNASLNPAGFDLRAFAPRYFLINGKAYPQTDPITTTSGNRLLVRYVNAGIQHHSMGVLGLRQTVVNEDGRPLANPRHMVAESISPGEAIDSLIDVPATAATSTTYLLYDASFGLNNTTGTGTNAGIGGMLTRIDAAGTASGLDTVGPIASNVTVDQAGALAASLSDATTGASSVAAAEYFIDAVGTSGTGTPMTGAFPSDPAAVSATVNVAALASGDHLIYVHGRDSLGNWGAPVSVALSTDTAGPATTSLVVTPPATNNAPVAMTGTGDDRSSGGANVVAAEYFVDALGPNGSGTTMTLSTTTSPVTSLSASVATSSLSTGAHLILVHARDAVGNWGPATSITLTIDRTGPTASLGSATPNPTNGVIGVNSTNPSLRVTATFDDLAPATIANAEIFIDAVGTSGTGLLMAPTDGLFNTVHEAGFVDVPNSTIALLANGNHTIFIHGKDSAGNWGPTISITLNVDKLGPTVSGAVLTPAAANAQAVGVSATASDVATGNHAIAGGEVFIDSVGSDGSGIQLTATASLPTTTITGSIPAATVAGLSVGNHTIYIHGRDIAGAWGPRVSTVLKIDRTAPTFSGITLTPATIASGTASVTMNVTGATDGATGSGVVGGEFWIANSNVPNGGGTAFNGLTAAVPTGSLVPGTYTVRVRIRDLAGNWSTVVRTATLTVTGPVPATIFNDGFDLQTLPGTWSSASTPTTTRLDVTTSAALSGPFGLRAQGNNTNYVQYNWGAAASPATATYDAKFLFRPNNQSSSGQTILAAGNSGTFGSQVFSVRYRRSGTTPQVQIQGGTATNTTWTNLLGGTSTNTIEVAWKAAGTAGPNAGTLRLYVNGVLSQTITTASLSTIASVRLGVVTASGNGNSEYFDGFQSTRTVP